MVNNQYVNPWTQEEEELAVSLLRQGVTLRKLADKLEKRTYNAVKSKNTKNWHIQTRYKLSDVSREELERLYWEQMFSLDEIGEIYGVKKSSVARKMKKLGIPRRKKTPSIRPALEPSEDLAYVLGVLLGDGSVFPINSNSSYAIQLTNTSKVFVESFANALKRIGIHPCFFDIPQENPNWNKQYGVKGHSILFGKWYETLAPSNIRKLLKTREMVVSFLRGFYESEGHTDKPTANSRRVSISNTNEELLRLVQHLVESLGYKTSIHGGKDIYIRGRKIDKERFLAELNPCIKRGD